MKNQDGKHSLGLLASVTVLIVGISCTLVATFYVRQNEQNREKTRFITSTDATAAYINQQLSRYIDLLYGARGFINTTNDDSRESWQHYVESLPIEASYPGLQGIGIAKRVRRDELTDHEAIQKIYYGNYSVLPPGAREEYYPIINLQPDTPRNRHAIGYDMFSEQRRNAAMCKARDTGQAVATSTLTLVQETDQNLQPGFLVYLPFYRPGAKLDTLEDRRESILGFVYSPYRIHNLLNGILANHTQIKKMHMHAYDGLNPQPDTLIYEIASDIKNHPDGTSHDVAISIAGQTWTLRFFHQDVTESGQLQLPLVILASGAITSLLLFGITFMQYRSRKRLAESSAALRISELRFRLKIEQSPLAIQLFDANGQSVYVNPAWEKLWDVTAEQASHYNIFNDEQLALSGQLLAVQRAFAGETVVIGPAYLKLDLTHDVNMHHKWVRIVMYPTRNTNSKVRELVMMYEDFTQRKETEEELRRAKERAEHARQTAEEASRAKDQFLAVLSHELRNPLAPVLTMVNALQSQPLTPEESDEALKVIRRNVELEARLIDDLLDITRIARGKLHLDMEIMDSHEALRDALRVCESDIAGKNLKITVKLDAGQTRINGDSARIEQVFWNLIKNAVKFTPECGEISIITRNESSRLLSHDSLSQELMIIEVSDTGIGIEPEKLSRIFDAFEQADRSITRRFGGLGLGLAISRALILAHGGTLEAFSRGKNKGTTFTIRLPITHRPAPAAHDAPASHDGIARNHLRILLVEDLDDARRGMAMILEKCGHTVRTAASVKEAFEVASGYEFDLLISDIGLPDGEGYTICQQLKKDRQFFAIALTGLGMEEDILHAREAGFDEHLTKPVHFARLEAMIARAEPKAQA